MEYRNESQPHDPDDPRGGGGAGGGPGTDAQAVWKRWVAARQPGAAPIESEGAAFDGVFRP